MPRRGISEKVFHAFNPMPDVTEERLIKLANLPLIEPSRRAPFDVLWKYAGGLDQERITLSPGETLVLRETEAQQFLTEFKELGMVVVEDVNDKDEVRRKRAEGLQKALTFYSDRGMKRVTEWRKTHGHSKEDLDDFKYSDLWVYYLNQAKADVVAEELQEVKARKRKSAAAR